MHRDLVCRDCSAAFSVEQSRGRSPSYCDACRSRRVRESNRRKMAAWRARNPERSRAAFARANERYLAKPENLRRKRDASRLRLYKLAPIDYERMLAAQKGRCAICGTERGSRALAVDHDHTTGRVRGLLCGLCNRLLGASRDDLRILRAAIRYLRR